MILHNAIITPAAEDEFFGIDDVSAPAL